ncbi:MAG: hypothetical protein ACFFCE_15800 [Promethearchaeota archaeon]
MVYVKEFQKEEPIINAQPISKTSELNIKVWVNRLKYDTVFKYSYLILYLVSSLIGIFFIMGIDLWYRANRYVIDILCIAIFIFSLFVGLKNPEYFHRLILENKAIFKNEKTFENYKKEIENAFKSKWEFIVPFFMGIGAFFFVFGGNFLINFEYGEWGGEKVYVEGITRIIYIISLFLVSVAYFILFTLAFSAIVIIIITFRCINKLGSEKFQLKVSYKELKIGAFNEIGKFIMSINIPVIAGSTFISIVGLFYIFTYRGTATSYIGYYYIGLGLAISVIMAFLLYKNTLHIHNSIVTHKEGLKAKIIGSIQDNLSEDNVNYMEIQAIHHFYNEILNISNWPFNPTSIKKFLITLGSSVVPFILSLFGLV